MAQNRISFGHAHDSLRARHGEQKRRKTTTCDVASSRAFDWLLGNLKQPFHLLVVGKYGKQHCRGEDLGIEVDVFGEEKRCKAQK